jgi:hypothetical protein
VIVDEMELVSRLKDAEPLRPEAFEQARMVLREAMAGSGLDRVSELDSVRVRRRRTRVGAGVIGVAGVAAAAAVALVVTLGLPQAGHPSRPQAGTRSASVSPVVNTRLVTLAALIKASEETPPGNATLVISSQVNGGGTPQVGANLYTDNGDYYWAPSESGLPEAIADHENLANGVDAREVAAALYAVNGDLAIARTRMVDASPNPFVPGSGKIVRPGPQKFTAAQKARLRKLGLKPKGVATPPTAAQLQEDFDNYIWNNSVDALTEGAGNPQVRIGVLRLISTLPEVTVTSSVTGGQPTLTLTAGTALFGGLTQQVLTINAKTGVPVSSVSGVPGQPPSSVVTYQVSRVTLANIAAGKF